MPAVRGAAERPRGGQGGPAQGMLLAEGMFPEPEAPRDPALAPAIESLASFADAGPVSSSIMRTDCSTSKSSVLLSSAFGCFF